MPTWTRTLRRAGITEPDLHAAYGRQRRRVRRFKPEEYLTVRLLLPAHLHPAVIATVAFMHETDQRIDTGAQDVREQALARWATATLDVLDGTRATDAILMALADTVVRHPQLKPRIEAFLHGARHEVDYAGFATEEELRTYVDTYSLPAFMLMACLLQQAGHAQDVAFEHRCRDLIESMQRTDFLEDLAEDAQQGHVGIPRQDLGRHGLTVEHLRFPTDDVRSSLTHLVREQVELAQSRLTASRQLIDLVPAQTRPFLRAMLDVQQLRLRAVHRNSGRLADVSTRPALPALLRILAREYRAARRQRQTP
ncbi:phytoene/squalene synthase family protein [Streptomyces sp. NPDC003635]